MEKYEKNTSPGVITLTTINDYFCASCSCGTGMLVPFQHALNDGAICCSCGAEVSLDSPTVHRLRAEEELRHKEHLKEQLAKQK